MTRLNSLPRATYLKSKWVFSSEMQNRSVSQKGLSQRARKFKKVQVKKLVKSNKSKFFLWNCIFGSFKLFPSSKIDFGHFWNCKKWKLIYLISRVFLAWTFLNFLAHCGIYRVTILELLSKYKKKDIEILTTILYRFLTVLKT